MQYTGPIYRFTPTVPKRLYPTHVYVECTLRVWAISRWRTARNFTEFFLAFVYNHLPRGFPMMFRVEEVIQNGVVVALLAHFTNTFDAFYLLGRVFWCGYEFTAFTTHNMFMEYTSIFPTASCLHTLPYPINNAPEEQ
ncbi:Auxin-induced protein 5NG4 [Hordeum vulgare]|nr:Auxin-induced protein 5NG4 [Hordeum vulgare]